MNGWKKIPWDGNPDLNLMCWRKKFGRGHVSVGCKDFLLIVMSYGADSDDSYSSTRWRKDRVLSEKEARDLVDKNRGKTSRRTDHANRN